MTANQRLRAGNVGRVSKDDSDEARSVGEQHDENGAAAGSHGWDVVAEYEDVMSASRFAAKARKDWPRLVADVEAGKLDVVIFWETSRGSRIAEEWLGFMRVCRERGVLIHITRHRHTYDLTVRRDWKTLASDGLDAEDDSAKISETVRRALAGNAEDGMPHSQAPFGYRRLYAPRKERLRMPVLQEIDEAEAALVRKVVGMIAAETPLSQIERETGVSRATMRKWCHNPAYVGKRRAASGLVPARWPAIIKDEETWRTAQAVLAGKPHVGVNSRPGGAKYLLTGIMGCCACPLMVESDPPSAHRRAAYSCRTGHVTIAQAGADEVIRVLVAARCAQDDLYQLLTAAAGDEAEAARADAGRLQAELDEWLGAGISPRAYKVKEDQYLPLIAAARDRAETLAVPAPLRDLVSARGDVAEVWHNMTVPQRRSAVRFLFERVTLGKSPRPGPGVPPKDRLSWEWRRFVEMKTLSCTCIRCVHLHVHGRKVAASYSLWPVRDPGRGVQPSARSGLLPLGQRPESRRQDRPMLDASVSACPEWAVEAAASAPRISPADAAPLIATFREVRERCQAATARHREREMADVPAVDPVQLRRRRDAADRLPPLSNGVRDPFGALAATA
jgi:site-specific DNA recombinase